MTTPYTPPPPGWYPDPQGAPYARWWDGTQWTAATQGGGPQWSDATQGGGPQWRPMATIARVVAALLVLMAFVQLGIAVALQRRRTVIDGYVEGTAPFDEVLDSDELVVGVTLLAITMLIAVAIVWLVWFHAAYRNAATLRHVRYPAWVIWGWLLPFVNLFRPKQMMNDVWMAGEEQLDAYTSTARVSFLVQAWWGTWIAGLLLNGVARQMGRRPPADALQGLYDAARVGTIAALLLAVAAVLAALVALRATDRLERRNAARTGGS